MARLMPYDLYERHSAVVTLLDNRPVHHVLDVGGRAGLLDRFADYNVVALNVDGSGDVEYGGHAFPFCNCAFDAVVSIDTLEHVPKGNRQVFVQECHRVAARCVIIAAPFGSPEHVASELRLNALYREVYGHAHAYLNEHVTYGLPTGPELAKLVASLGPVKQRLYFAGNFEWQATNFESVWLAKHRSGAWLGIRRLWNHLSSKALFHSVQLKTQPYATANRFYLYLEKVQFAGNDDENGYNPGRFASVSSGQ
jgi:SAM-dependent methyltransferase